MTMSAGYDLHLYCDVDGCKAKDEIQGETFSECAKIARKRKWVINKKGWKCYCPEHAKMAISEVLNYDKNP